MTKRSLILADLDCPVAPATADVTMLAPVVVGAPATAVVIGAPAKAVVIGAPAKAVVIGAPR